MDTTQQARLVPRLLVAGLFTALLAGVGALLVLGEGRSGTGRERGAQIPPVPLAVNRGPDLAASSVQSPNMESSAPALGQQPAGQNSPEVSEHHEPSGAALRSSGVSTAPAPAQPEAALPPAISDIPESPSLRTMSETEMMEELRRPLPFADRVFEGRQHERRNELMNVLRERGGNKPAVTDLFVNLYRDATQGQVMRSYAVQHLARWLETGGISMPDRERALTVIREAVASWTNEAIGGAGLIALRQVAGQEAGPPALAALANDQAQASVRMAALQVCSELGEKNALGAAERIANDKGADAVLRMTAVAAMAALGGKGAAPGLSMLAQDRDARVRRAAELALSRLAVTP